jgi:two-component system, NtrC family, sensor kinase
MSAQPPPMDPVTPSHGIAPVPLRHSLRAQGFIATMALLLYVLASVVYVATQRAKIYDSMQTLQAMSRHERALALAGAAVGSAVVDVNESSSAAQPSPTMPAEIALYMENCTKLFAALEEFDPRYVLLQRAIARSYASVQEAPLRANWIDLRESLARAASELDIRQRSLNEQRDTLMHAYQRQYDTVTVESLMLSLLGIAVFGALAAWFFARLAGDIRQLESHARQIVHGARGVDMPVARQDELGRLMHAVNRLSTDLDQREKQIELDSERRSHADKMLAVGALAAGVAHEVNNPLAVISGAAQELGAMQGRPGSEEVTQAVQLILAQAQRASLAARNLAELVAPQPTTFDWVDINAMVRRVLQLMGYDKRYRNIAFDSRLATDIPAVQAPGATMQHVLMQLVSMGCDAMAAAHNHGPVIVATQVQGNCVEIQLVFPLRLDFARAEVQRALLLVRAIIEPMHVRLEVHQDAPELHNVKLLWPSTVEGDT